MQRANILLSHLLADSTEESCGRHLQGAPCAESPPPGQEGAKDAAGADDKADEEGDEAETNAPELEVQVLLNSAKQRYGPALITDLSLSPPRHVSHRYELVPLPNRVSFDQGFFYTMRAIELVRFCVLPSAEVCLSLPV
jgi:hypothetical protein